MPSARSESTAPSPLAFARAWQEYRAAAARTPFPDTRLLLAARFWQAHPQALPAPAFKTYAQEDLPPLLAIVDKVLPGDLLPDELEEVALFAEAVVSGLDEGAEPALVRVRGIWEEAACGWFYVGEVERALITLSRTGLLQDQGGSPSPPGRGTGEGTAPVSASTLTPTLSQREREKDTAPSPEGSRGFAETSVEGNGIDPGIPPVPLDVQPCDIPAILAEHYSASCPDLAQWLQRFAASWQARQETGDPHRAHCLLVEYDTHGRPVRGRIRTLQGTLAPLGPDAQTDEIVFHHQVRAPDDPFVGTAYNALAALRTAGARGRGLNGKRHRAAFSLGGGNEEVYSGNSIGLAAFAVAYAGRWAGELHRDRRMIADTVAFTGGVDARGEAQPVSGESLPVKIRGAFHSPVEYVVVPEGNRREAEDCAARFREQYPRRRLHIIGVEDTADIIADHNILRTEKLCVGEFTIRAAARLSRNVKVQVPVLAVMLYVLLCLVYPRAWVGFDWNPATLQLSRAGIRVTNAEGDGLWEWTSPCGSVDTSRSAWVVADLDGDGENEVSLLSASAEGVPCSVPAALYVFNRDGELRFSRTAAISGEYPGDSTVEQRFSNLALDVVETSLGKRIVTRLAKSDPARMHIQFWTPAGRRAGWYIQAGFMGRSPNMATLGDRVCFTAYNNRMNGATALFVLFPDSSFGCSPPYSDPRHPELDVAWVKRGNQATYVLLPRSDLGLARNRPYSDPGALHLEAHGLLLVWVIEAGNRAPSETGLRYNFDHRLRVIDVQADDYFWPARDSLVVAGILPPVDHSAYLSALRDSVRYWTDSGWVSEEELRSRQHAVPRGGDTL